MTQVRKVDAMFNAVAFAVKTCDKTNGCTDSQHTYCLQKKILDYFNATNDNNVPDNMGQTRFRKPHTYNIKLENVPIFYNCIDY